MRDWTEEQRALRDAVVAAGRLLGDRTTVDRTTGDRTTGDRTTGDRGIPEHRWDLLRGTGLFRLPFAEAWGGIGEDLPTTMFALEGLGYSCRDAGLAFAAAMHMVSVGIPLHRFGPPRLRQRLLPAVCDGSVIAGHAVTEPGGGTDVLDMRTTATPDGDDFVLTGSKTNVGNGPVAGLFVVYALTGSRGDPTALTAFVVEADRPGVAIGWSVEKPGPRGWPLCELHFDGCRVPRSNVIGAVGSGLLVLEQVTTWEILCSLSITVGQMQHRMERCIDYARTRLGGGISSTQPMSSKIVDMKIGVESSRRWIFDTAEKAMRGEDVDVDLAIAKLLTSESNVSSALAAIQVFGGHGQLAEYGIERDLPNAVAATFYSGITQAQRQRIATLIGL